LYVKPAKDTIRPSGAVLALIAGVSLCGCTNLAKNNYYLPSGVDSNSPVAAQVTAAEHAPGVYPRFSQIPPAPTDVRPLSAWRASVSDALAQKRQADAGGRNYPYTLGDTEAFARAAQARIPVSETAAPTADATKAAEDYAAKVRGRATTPPPPN
jgi:hypothetical protein